MAGRLGSNAMAKKWRSGFGLGCLGGVILTVLTLAVIGSMARRAPERFPAPVRSFFGADGTVVAAGGEGSSLSLEQIRAIRGVQPTVQVTLTEADINSYLHENPDAVGLPKGFKNPRVRFQDGRVRLLVSTRVLLLSTRINIAMEPSIEAGELKLAVRQIEAGGIDLPGELRQIAEQRVADLLADRLGEAGLRPESVAVGDGKLTVAARLVPVDAPVQDTLPEADAAAEPAAEPEQPSADEAETDADDDPRDTEDAGPSAAPRERDWWPGR